MRDLVDALLFRDAVLKVLPVDEEVDRVAAAAMARLSATRGARKLTRKALP